MKERGRNVASWCGMMRMPPEWSHCHSNAITISHHNCSASPWSMTMTNRFRSLPMFRNRIELIYANVYLMMFSFAHQFHPYRINPTIKYSAWLMPPTGQHQHTMRTALIFRNRTKWNAKRKKTKEKKNIRKSSIRTPRTQTAYSYSHLRCYVISIIVAHLSLTRLANR